MKNFVWLLLAAAILSGCRKQPQTQLQAQESHDHTVSITNWTDKTELFMEHPLLVPGAKARFAVHLTRLDNFRALTAGRVEVRLERNGAVESFVTDGPSRPGIFGVDVVPKHSGTSQMSVHVSASGWSDIHKLGAAMVYPDANAADVHKEAEPTEETIAFSKEQQWTLDFATDVARERGIRESMRVPAEIVPRTGGEAEVTVPFAGRLAAESLPPIGTHVQKGQVLARLIPPTDRPADYPALQLEKSQAETALALARRDRERAERLLGAGAVPAKRLEEAQATEISAQARLQAANQRLNQYEQTRRAAADQEGAPAFLLRAPIAGAIAETHGTPGANVEPGETLVKIVDVQTTYVSGHVSEADLPRLQRVTGAELEVPGSEQPRRTGRLVSIGRIVDPQSRTIDIVYEIDNRDRRLAIGQGVSLRLFTSATNKAPAIPQSAIVDDGGRPVVFVQKGGEAFVRRPVKLGAIEASHVHVLEGVKPGERVVTRGAHLVRLASMSSQAPAHGHVH